jgi:hypothetical protein
MATALDVSHTRVRGGTNADLPAITRLIDRANANHCTPHIDEHELEAVANRGRLIVLPLQPGELAAAACVAPGRGLVFLVIDPAVANAELENRMIGVADALCDSERTAGFSRGRR